MGGAGQDVNVVGVDGQVTKTLPGPGKTCLKLRAYVGRGDRRNQQMEQRRPIVELAACDARHVGQLWQRVGSMIKNNDIKYNNQELCLQRMGGRGSKIEVRACNPQITHQWFNQGPDGGLTTQVWLNSQHSAHHDGHSLCLEGLHFQPCGSKTTEIGRDGGFMPAWRTEYWAKKNQKWVWEMQCYNNVVPGRKRDDGTGR